MRSGAALLRFSAALRVAAWLVRSVSVPSASLRVWVVASLRALPPCWAACVPLAAVARAGVPSFAGVFLAACVPRCPAVRVAGGRAPRVFFVTLPTEMRFTTESKRFANIRVYKIVETRRGGWVEVVRIKM